MTLEKMTALSWFNYALGSTIAIFIVWFPRLNGQIWMFKSWNSVTGFALTGVQSVSANFGTMSGPRVQAQVVSIPGGCSILDSQFEIKQPAIAIVHGGGYADDVLVAQCEDWGFSGVIVVSTDDADREPMVGDNNLGIKIPSVKVSEADAKLIEAQGSAEFRAKVDHERTLSFALKATTTILVTAILMILSKD